MTWIYIYIYAYNVTQRDGFRQVLSPYSVLNVTYNCVLLEKAVSRLAAHVLFILYSSKLYYRLYKTPLLDLVLSQINAVHILISSFVVIIVVPNYINNNGDIINVVTNRR